MVELEYILAYQSSEPVTPGIQKGLKLAHVFWVDGVCSATLSAEIALFCVAQSTFIMGSESWIDLGVCGINFILGALISFFPEQISLWIMGAWG